jgi:hypothetical protein
MNNNNTLPPPPPNTGGRDPSLRQGSVLEPQSDNPPGRNSPQPPLSERGEDGERAFRDLRMFLIPARTLAPSHGSRHVFLIQTNTFAAQLLSTRT